MKQIVLSLLTLISCSPDQKNFEEEQKVVVQNDIIKESIDKNVMSKNIELHNAESGITINHLLTELNQLDMIDKEVRGDDYIKVEIFHSKTLGYDFAFPIINEVESDGFFLVNNQNNEFLYFGLLKEYKEYNINSIDYLLIVDKNYQPKKGIHFTHSHIDFESVFGYDANGSLKCTSELVSEKTKISKETAIKELVNIMNVMIIEDNLTDVGLYSTYPFRSW